MTFSRTHLTPISGARTGLKCIAVAWGCSNESLRCAVLASSPILVICLGCCISCASYSISLPELIGISPDDNTRWLVIQSSEGIHASPFALCYSFTSMKSTLNLSAEGSVKMKILFCKTSIQVN